jgi:hypothetical protein
MALLPSDRNNNNISSNTTANAILVGATCGVIGVVVGLVLPSLFQRLTLGVIRSAKNDTTITTTSSEGCKSSEDGGDGTHSVRSGLKNDSSSSSSSIRINQSKLNSFLRNILIKAATTTSSTTTGGDMKLKEKMDLVASVLTYADSRGIPSHGSNRCDTYVNEIVVGLVNANADPV